MSSSSSTIPSSSSGSTAANSASGGSGSNTMRQLGPAWYRGERSGGNSNNSNNTSSSSNKGGSSFGPPVSPNNSNSEDRKNNFAAQNMNSFSAFLDSDDEDNPTSNNNTNDVKKNNVTSSTTTTTPTSRKTSNNFSGSYKSRSDAFLGDRGGFSSSSSRPLAGSSIGTRNRSSGSGRSLADLAARTPSSGSSGNEHRGSIRGPSSSSSSSGGGVSGLGYHRSSSMGSHHSSHHHNDSSSSYRERMNEEMEKKVIRYTRERLLSMRPMRSTGEDVEIPSFLKPFENSVIFSKNPQDPVCFDDFDADEIWAQALSSRGPSRSSSTGIPSSGSTPKGEKTSSSGPSSISAGLRRGSIEDLALNNSSQLSSERGASNSNSFGGGRWQRGVALPPPSSTEGRGAGGSRSRHDDAENPEDLWDDPIVASTTNDLSEFGAPLDSNETSSLSRNRSNSHSGTFDLSDMAEATRKFEDARSSSKKLSTSSRSSSFVEAVSSSSTSIGTNAAGADILNSLARGAAASAQHAVDPKKPLAQTGTTIQSGSGDNVNVFEDFGNPMDDKSMDGAIHQGTTIPSVSSSDKINNNNENENDMEEDNPSSRLMKMIGVTTESTTNNNKDTEIGAAIPSSSSSSTSNAAPAPTPTATGGSKLLSTWGSGLSLVDDPVVTGLGALGLGSVPSNPWGDPIINIPTQPDNNNSNHNSLTNGLNIANHLVSDSQQQQEKEEQQRRAALEQQQQQKAAEEEKQRQQAQAQQQAQLEAQRQAQQQQQQQAAEMQRQQQQAQAQQAQPQSSAQSHYNMQVEQILMERISNVLESNWGRAELSTILKTLHNEDARVVPLLRSTNELKALLTRHPNRVGIQVVNAGAGGAGAFAQPQENAILLMTNAQFQQHQIQKQREEEFQRQQQQQAQLQKQQMMQERQRQQQQEEAQALLRLQQQQQQQQKKSIKITNGPWFYADPQGNIQGPFKGEEMRQWLDAGYFKGDLPVSQNPTNGSFQTLSSLFPDPSLAFQPTEDNEPPPQQQQHDEREEEARSAALLRQQQQQEEAQAQAALKAQQQAQAQAAEKAKMEQEERAALAYQKEQQEAMAVAAAREAAAAAAAEAEKQQAMAAAAQDNPNTSSAQLKMLLGLGAAGDVVDDDLIVGSAAAITSNLNEVSENNIGKSNNNDKATLVAPTPVVQQAPSNKSTSAPTPTSIPTPVVVAPVPAPAPKPAPVAWGGAATAASKMRGKSMSEIQQEEARVSAQQKKRMSRSSSGGWANVAASGGGKGGWSSGAVKTVSLVSSSGGNVNSAATSSSTAASVVRATAATSNKTSTGIVHSVSSKSASQQSQTTTAAQAQAQQPKASVNKVIEDFGASGKMSPSLEAWCKEQMRKLNGSDDLTLIAFCMSLTDPIEIRQYLTAYLGSSSQVNNFASEFINRKAGGKPKQDEWESAGNSKKKNKKKNVAK